MIFGVLGNLLAQTGAAQTGARLCVPSAPMQRKFLGFLLVRANQPVHVSDLIEELWGDEPPSTAAAALQTYAMQLRKRLRPMLSDGGDVKDLLATVPMGYMLRIHQRTLDVHTFEDAADAGRQAFLEADYHNALIQIRRALSVWRGPALFDVPRGRHLSAFATQANDQRLHMEELRVDAELQLGHHRELLGSLLALTSRHHLNEALHSRLMLALYRSGRRTDALKAYRGLERRMMAHGMQPARVMRQLHDAILRDSTDLVSLSLGRQALNMGFGMADPRR